MMVIPAMLGVKLLIAFLKQFKSGFFKNIFRQEACLKQHLNHHESLNSIESQTNEHATVGVV